MNSKLGVHKPIITIDPDLQESLLLLKGQSWWNHYSYLLSLSTSLKETERKKRTVLAFGYCFLWKAGSSCEEAGQASWD